MNSRLLVRIAVLLVNVLAWVMLTSAAIGQDVQREQTTLKIMTYNIRYDNPGDGLNSWNNRKDFVSALMQFHGADIICIQEGLLQQVHYLRDALKEFEFCGVGRDDGKEAGEYAAIFFRKSMFDQLAGSTFWLSPSPAQPGKGWDAALPRIVTWASLRFKSNGRSFVVFNTHFDHMGEIARRESARLLRAQIPRIAGDRPVIVTGDFNSTEQDSAYQILVKPMSGIPLLKDSYGISRQPHYGITPTFFGFDARTTDPGERIDFVFVSDRVIVLRHGTLSDFRDGRFPSDHLPVLVEIALPE